MTSHYRASPISEHDDGSISTLVGSSNNSVMDHDDALKEKLERQEEGLLTQPNILPYTIEDTLVPPATNPDAKRTVKWIDGLRGIASLIVLCTHISRMWMPDLFRPANAPTEAPYLFQLPFLRIPFQGRIGVTIFAFLTGYVCGLKPLKLARQGKHLDAYETIGRSAFRRVPRLFFPAVLAACIAWAFTQVGAFRAANYADNAWLRYSTIIPLPTLRQEVHRLWDVLCQSWFTEGKMEYDDAQWALLPLLKGSMIIYITLCATMFATFGFRLAVYGLMIFYWHINFRPDTETFGQQIFFGLLLSDVAQHAPFTRWLDGRAQLKTLVPMVCIPLGLFVASYPEVEPENTAWSSALQVLATWIFPAGTNIPKRYSALGLDLIVIGIFVSPTIKHILTSKTLLWLGKHSFAVYLLHGTIMRSLFTWMVYSSQIPLDAKGNVRDLSLPPAEPWIPPRSNLVLVASVPVFLAMVYGCAVLWVRYVDGRCERWTKRLEEMVFVKEESGRRGTD